jgi:predicted O-methyltransferase YrrM
VLIVDNALWGGSIFDDENYQPSVEGVRELTRRLSHDPGWVASLVPLRDGLIVAYKK